MAKVFDNMRKLKGLCRPEHPGRVWNDATAMVPERSGRCMQLMGDWARGEIVNAKTGARHRHPVRPAPGNKGTYLFHGDFEFFAAKGDAKAAQDAFASAIMNPSFQETFNLVKGSIPARMDARRQVRRLRQGSDDRHQAAAIAAGSGCCPTSMAARRSPRPFEGAIQDVVTQHFNSDQSSQDAAAALVRPCRPPSNTAATGGRRCAVRGGAPQTAIRRKADARQQTLRRVMPFAVISPSLALIAVCIYGFIALYGRVVIHRLGKMFPRFNFVGFDQYARVDDQRPLDDRWSRTC